MLEVFDRFRRRVAIAENAHDVTEDQKVNELWYLHFTLPYQDPKNAFCQPFWFVRWNGGELYRIMPTSTQITDTGSVTYQCEHVLATLADTVLFGYHVVGNLGTYTADCINYLLSRQSNWVLADCDFRNQYEYGWEQENLLSALFSIASPLESYIWKTDTSVYPWRLSLKRLNLTGVPNISVQRARNMLTYGAESNPQELCTRLYPLGYGEGVNQLVIRDINGGLPYLQSPQSYIDRYGLIERIWTDRRYEDPASLKAAAQAMLDQLQEPAVSYQFGLADIDGLVNVGDRVRMKHPGTHDFTDTYITAVSYRYDDITSSTVTVANKDRSIASTVADLSDRQRIEQTYSQGATQLYSQALQTNCDSKNGAVMDFFIPSEMRVINKIFAKIRLDKFRAYSRSTVAAEAFVASTSTENEVRSTSSSGGGGVLTSKSGGSTTATSKEAAVSGSTYSSTTNGVSATDSAKLSLSTQSGGGKMQSHAHLIVAQAHEHAITKEEPHSHQLPASTHAHEIFVDPHAHDVSIPNHTHDFTIPAHRHNVPIPAHAHDIIPGIYEFGNANSFSVYVKGQLKETFSGTDAEINLTNYLLGDDRRVPRGSWLSVEVRPNDLAYVSIDLIFQGFVQSRGDMTV